MALFKKKQSETNFITKEQLKQSVVVAINEIRITKNVPITYLELLDIRNDAMQIFINNNTFTLTISNIAFDKRIIDKYIILYRILD